jgi:hypothetical protein
MAGKERFPYYNADTIGRIPDSAFIQDVFSLLAQVPLEAEFLDIKPGVEFISGIGVRGTRECYVELSKPDEPSGCTDTLSRSRGCRPHASGAPCP